MSNPGYVYANTYGPNEKFCPSLKSDGTLSSGSWTKLSQIRAPSGTFLIAERYYASLQMIGNWYHILSSNIPDNIPRCHSGGDNYLFCDGHVEWRAEPDPDDTGFWTIDPND